MDLDDFLDRLDTMVVACFGFALLVKCNDRYHNQQRLGLCYDWKDAEKDFDNRGALKCVNLIEYLRNGGTTHALHLCHMRREKKKRKDTVSDHLSRTPI